MLDTHNQSSFWGWGFTPKDNQNEQLNIAMQRYMKRFGKRPFLVFCNGVLLAPVQGLQVKHDPFMPANAFYFAIKGGDAID
jgi:hypothetical protein